MRFWSLALAFTLLIGSAARAAAEPITYVAIGASDSVGVGAFDPAHEGWVPRLAGMLGPETRVVNLGMSGALVQDALAYQLPPAIDADPDLVTLWLGVNDFNALVPLSVYATQLDEALALLQGRTHARIVIGNLPDLSRVRVYASVLDFLGIDASPVQYQVARWNAVIAALAQRHEATLVDLHAEWSELASHPEYVSSDGFHPSSAGYARVAELFHAAVAG
jgi:lysophospholipase L1-like esterase